MRAKRSSFIAAALALGGTISVLPGTARATPIDYIFGGTGTGSLGTTPFSGSFTVTEFGDTSAVVSSGFNFLNFVSSATFSAGTLSATLAGSNLVIDDVTAPGAIAFAQPALLDVEWLINPAFETYDLKSGFATTSGALSVAPEVFATMSGSLRFTEITSLSFTATTSGAVPEPASMLLFCSGLLGFALLTRRRRA